MSAHEVPAMLPPDREDERYRIYRLRGKDLYLIATTDKDGIGTAIVTLSGEGEFDGCRVGIYDSKLRTWVLNPWSGAQS